MHAVLAPFFIVTVYDIVYVMSNIVKLAVHSEDKTAEIPHCTNGRSILVSIVEKIFQLVSKLTLADTVEIVIQISQLKNNQNKSNNATIKLHIFNHTLREISFGTLLN